MFLICVSVFLVLGAFHRFCFTSCPAKSTRGFLVDLAAAYQKSPDGPLVVSRTECVVCNLSIVSVINADFM